MAAQAVIWHPEAQEDYRDIVSYFLEEWSFEVADKFTSQVDEVVNLLQSHPNIGMRVGRLRSVRKIAVPPHYFLYYIFFQNQILVFNILDNRQKPESL